MTVSRNQDPFERYQTAASSFTFNFPRHSNNEVVVYAERVSDGQTTLMVEDTDYTLSGILPSSGTATVTLVNNSQAWMTGANLNAPTYAIIIEYSPVGKQETNFKNLGRFAPISFGKVLDQIVMTMKAQQRVIERTIQFRRKDITDGHDPVLPDAISNNADKVIAVNLAADGVQFGHTVTAFNDLVTQVDNLAAIVAALQSSSGDSLIGYVGFSARFNEAFNTTTTEETLDQIVSISYVGPSVSLSASGSGTVREYGDAVSSTTLTASVTQTSAPIAQIEFFAGGVSIDNNAPPANTGSGNTAFVYSTSFDTPITFRVDVTDDGSAGGPSTVSSSRSFTFVYPYYYGVGAAGLSAAQVAALTKDVRSETTSYNRSFGATTGEVYYFAYPASYGTLSSIIDSNGFETFNDWTLTVADITGLDGNPISYNIYEFDNVVTAGGTNYIFGQ